MRFEGCIKKDARFWLAEIPAFDAVTQGRTKREAFAMIEDLIETMADTRGFKVKVHPLGGETFEIEANRIGVVVALLLRRQRERHGLTLNDVAERLGQSSPNAYARYEQGRAMPSVEKLEQLLKGGRPGSADRLAHRRLSVSRTAGPDALSADGDTRCLEGLRMGPCLWKPDTRCCTTA